MLHIQPRYVGPITAYGGQTYITSQTGAGSTFAMQAGPTFTGTVKASGGLIQVYDTTQNRNGGLATEVSAAILNIGVNDDSSNRFGGAYTSADQGGFFRIDTRSGQSLFALFARAAGSTSGVSKVASVDSSGNIVVTGTLSAVGRSNYTASSEPYSISARFSNTGGPVYFGARDNTADPGFQISNAAGTAIISGTSAGNVTIAGTTTLSSTLGVTGAATLSSTLDVTGAITGSSSITDSKADVRTIPQNSKSAAYTTVLSDAGKHILHPSADTTARTFTIDSNANVAYPIGTAITFVNQNSAGTVTISITSDTMRLAGPGTTGSRTLAANGVATALKITSTEWIIWGVNLS